MKVAIFTPTYRWGGLDVLEASLARQTHEELVWIVADEHYAGRYWLWEEIQKRLDIEVIASKGPPLKGNNRRNLAAAYNWGASLAMNMRGVQLFVSLQDYIWIAENGVERFVSLHDRSPESLLTGLTSISFDPVPEKIVEIRGKYSIFDEPFTDKPKHIDWRDPRDYQVYILEDSDRIVGVKPEHWESNWAAVPIEYFRELGCFWDERYDRGIAYENIDFARRTGAQILMDRDNLSISLPHKDYFEGEREEIEEYSNRAFYEEEWL